MGGFWKKNSHIGIKKKKQFLALLKIIVYS
jgi:hypothetical protein